MIKTEIQSIETDLQWTIVDDAARKKISTLTKKRKNLTESTDVLWWLVSLITVFVYRLFL
jgi:lysozyme family protein